MVSCKFSRKKHLHSKRVPSLLFQIFSFTLCAIRFHFFSMISHPSLSYHFSSFPFPFRPLSSLPSQSSVSFPLRRASIRIYAFPPHVTRFVTMPFLFLSNRFASIPLPFCSCQFLAHLLRCFSKPFKRRLSESAQ